VQGSEIIIFLKDFLEVKILSQFSCYEHA
jgi:hypothetical protein